MARLIGELLADLDCHVVLVYTPSYDPDANRIEGLWRVVRRAVTHNHHREDFAVLMQDVQAECDMLHQNPAAVPQHTGSPGPAALDAHSHPPLAVAA